MTEFNVGDVVQLNSGGPPMTISSIGSGTEQVICQWFDEGKLESGKFPKDVLTAAEHEHARKKKK